MTKRIETVNWINVIKILEEEVEFQEFLFVND
jgi:hypothetical protein